MMPVLPVESWEWLDDDARALWCAIRDANRVGHTFALIDSLLVFDLELNRLRDAAGDLLAAGRLRRHPNPSAGLQALGDDPRNRPRRATGMP